MFTAGWPSHTYSVMARCPREGLLGIAVTSSPIAVTTRCAFVRANVGAGATQAYTNPAVGDFVLNLLETGYSPERALAEWRANDTWSEYRQIGVVDRYGHSAVHSGGQCMDWKGHRHGPNYVVMGNYLTRPEVVEAMDDAWHSSEPEILEERMLRCLEAGWKAGGDNAGPPLSAGMIVHRNAPYPRTDLRSDMYQGPAGTCAVDDLRRIFDAFKPLIPYYEERVDNPLIEPWYEWLEKRKAAT